MKKTIMLLCAVAALAACGNNAKKGNAETGVVEEVVVVDVHNAQNSLDYLGTYKGTLPCADCEGVATEITLNNDGTFAIKNVYQGKGDGEVYEATGTYTWNEAGNTVILEGVKDAPFQYFVGENVLKQLDLDGNFITGELADSYILVKVAE